MLRFLSKETRKAFAGIATVLILQLLPGISFGQVTHLVISQIYGGGGNSGATYTNDYIEIFNPTGSTVSLSGWSVQYASAGGTSWSATNLTGSIAPGQYYLIQEALGTGGTTSLPTPQATGSIAMSATAGKVALVNSTTALSGGCTGSTIIDVVGFGSGTSCNETSAAPAPSNTTAILRASGGCTDANNNSTDFATGTPTPRNSATTARYCYPVKLKITSITPSTPTAGSGFDVVVKAVDFGGTANSVITTTAFSLSTNGPAGTIGGTTTGSFSAGTNTYTVTGVTLSAGTSGSPVAKIMATRTSGDALIADTSAGFIVNSASGCTGTPSAGTASGTPASLCGSGTSAISLSGGSYPTGVSYQWQVSSTGSTGSFSNISGATGTTFTSGTLSATTYYRCYLTCSTSDTSTTAAITVNSLPSTISGTLSVCQGSTTTLSDGGGGTWTSANTSVATAVSSSGTITGVATGTAIITYTLSSGCYITAIVTVNPTPSSISGTLTVCAGTTTTLTDAGGGTWASSNTAVATAASSGDITGVAAGTATVTYALATGCRATAVVTVITTPSAGSISGLSSVPVGSTITLTESATGGIWSSSAPSVASIGSTTGVVSGVAAGSAVITYTVSNSCGSAVATTTITAISVFAPGNIVVLKTGDGSGALSSAAAPLSLIEFNASGTATGMSVSLPSSGSTKITNSGSAGSEGFITLSAEKDRIIIPGYDAASTTSNVASSSSSSVNREIFSVTSDGTYSRAANTTSLYSGNNFRSASASGTDYFGSGPTSGLTYLGPGTAAQLTTTVTNTNVLQVINGQSYFSSKTSPFVGISRLGTGIPTTGGQTASLVTSTSTSDPLSFSISPDGNTMYVADDGAGVIKYTWSGSSFVAASTITATATRGLTVDWSATNPVIYATTTATSANSIIKMTDAGGAVTVFTVTTAPANTGYRGIVLSPTCYASVAARSASLCNGDSTVIIISGNPNATVAYNINGSSTLTTTIGNNGLDTLRTGALSSTTTYNLTAITTTACSAVSLAASATVTVNAIPPAITGTTNICGGATASLANSSGGGTWSSSNTAVASVNSTSGTVSGISTGTTVITYTLSSGCKTTSNVTVNTTPSAIAGSTAVCAGATATLSDTSSGGTWTSSNTAVVTVTATGGTTTYTGVAVGTAVISYTLASGCAATIAVAVNSSPSAIAGTTTVCAGGTTTLTNVGGGTWASSNSAIADIGTATGILSGVSAGTAEITYSLGGSCIVTATVTINTAVAAISGSFTVCPTATTTLSNSTGSGVWSSSNTAVATVVSGTGVVSGVSPGTTTITYFVSTGCSTTAVVTVNPLPSAGIITGTTTVYIGAVSTLSNATSGGVWSSSNTATATIASGSGIVNGVAAGTTVVSYTVTNSCGSAVTTATVNVPVPFVLGNLVVEEPFNSSSNASKGIRLLQYTTTGTLVGTSSLPFSGSSRITISGTASSEGYASLSAERDRLVFTGYDADSGSSSVASSSSATINRATGSVAPSGAYTRNFTTTQFSGNNVRSGTAYGTNFFAVGAANGEVLMNTSTSLSTTVTNIRQIGIFNGNTYFTTGSGSSRGLYQVGTGISAATGQTATVIANQGGSGNPFGFAISPDGNVLYLADNTSGIVKFTRSGGTGSFSAASYTVYGGAACSGLAVDFSTTNPTIYATTLDGLNLIKLTDAGSTVTSPTTLATSTSAAPFRGLSFTPAAYASVSGTATICSGDSATITFSGNPHGTVTYNVNGGSNQTIQLDSATASATLNTHGLSITSTFSLVSITTPSGTAALSGSTVITVNPLPSTITGPTTVCAGLAGTLGSSSTGGTWVSAATGVATIGSTSGLLSGVSAGTTIITYTLTTGCSTTTVVTVNASPASITGTSSLCEGATTSLGNTTSGGIWTSTATGIASVGSSGTSTTVSGVSAGTTTISYTLSTGCTATTIVTVNPIPSAITGTATVCEGAITALSNTGGGTWASSNTSVATIGTGSGIVSGIAAGTTTITYALATGCTTTTIVTVNPIPSSITGTATVCAGATTTLSNTGGGTWASNNTSVATIGTGSGVVSGIAAGTTTITYALATGCTATTIVTVNPMPSAITGTATVCEGATNSLSNTGGGTWASSNTSVATIGTASGIVSGIAAGTTTITYALATGCTTTTIVTVKPLPSAITGTATVCEGAITTLGNTGGGTWASNNTSVATIGTGSGVVSGIAAGTTTITYALATGCTATTIVTVNPIPSAITGAATVCAGSTTTLSNTGGGTWASSNTSIATIGTSSGIVSGIAAGTTTITYALATGCTTTTIVTVNPIPSATTGTATVCEGATTTLSNTGSGTWASNNTSVATIGTGSGIVSGIAAGTTTITYALATGCTTTTIVTVNPIPSAITGTATVCEGATTTLSNTGGGTWASGNTSVATIGTGSGIVSGIAAGTTTITYALATCCTTTTIVTVNPIPSAITGAATVCEGSTTTLSNTGGGTWASSNTSVATIGTGSGIVSGIAAGTTTITYALATGCTTTTIVTVNPIPSAITGTAIVCEGATTTLSNTGGGTWASSNTSVATIGTGSGIVSGIAAGTTTITYALATGCTTTTIVTVNPIPSAITGTAIVCEGATTTLSNTGGGTWASSNTSVATIGTGSGIVSGIAAGTTTITYALATGCTTTTIVTVTPIPSAITGTATVCEGATTTLSNTGGGSWASSNTGVATIGTGSGIVSGIAVGTTTITYALATGCATTTIVTVNPIPSAITGTATVCAGATTTLSSTGGGTWASSNTSVATIGTGSGIVSGIAAGTTTITYALATGCTATTIVTVNPIPSAITGTATVCEGATTTLSNTGGGTWASSNTSVATIGTSSGIVSGIAAGTTTITYALATGCTATTIVTVNPIPSAITGTATVCEGATTTLSNTGGGTWASSNTSVATIGTGSGIVSGIAAGTTTITYALATGCTATTIVTVNPIPSAITGTATVCEGAATTLSNTGGGTWASSNTSVATIGTSSGIVSGIAAGTTTITYALATGCATTTIVTVNPIPSATTGTATVCEGSTTTLSNTGGGTWASSNTSVATIGTGSGIVSGIAAGTTTITYALATGCATTTIVTVNTIPSVTTGTATVCEGATTALSNTGGGTWASSNTSVATIGTGSGVVSGIAAGTTTITYALATGCTTTTIVTVNPIPSAITGTATVCAGSTTTLSNTGGGTWASSNTSVATIGTGSGIVSGIAAGTTTITYALATGCATTTIVTVNPIPSAITGTATVCAGATTTLSNTGGGTWASSNTSVATIGTGSGIVSGIAAGTTTITYAIGTCFTTAIVTVNITPSPISGITTVCVGSTTTLTDAGGGTWISSNSGVATVGGSSGAISAVSAGTSVISYTLSGCVTSTVVSVITTPHAITGSTLICVGSTTLLNSAGGGTWSSSDASIATAAASSGIISGVATGTATITYTLPCGISTTVVTVGSLGGAPAIASIAPATAIPLSSVTISGSNFNLIPASNIVFFGATRATVMSSSSSSLTVTVPVSATYMPVSVENTGCALTGYSQQAFLPTYNNSAFVSASVNFANKVDFTTGTQPFGIAITDIDGDGKADIAVVNISSNTVSIYRNTSASGPIGSGSFAAKVDFVTGTQPYGIAIRDIDGDGKPDIAVANLASNNVSVLRNTSTPGSVSSASFAAKVDFATGTNPISIAINDIDGDGKPELVTANYYTSNISVIRNISSPGAITTGSFAPKTDFVAGSHPYSIAVADIDGDAKADIIVANNGGNTVSVLRNTATIGAVTSSSMATKLDFAVGTAPASIAAGDIDGDNKPDIITANTTSNNVSVLRNTSTPGSLSMAGKVDFVTGTSPKCVTIGDFDGDGKADLAVANSGSNTFSILRNTATTGAITSGSFAAKTDFMTGSDPRFAAVGDLDGDFIPDVVVANFASNTLSVMGNAPLYHAPTITSLSSYSNIPGTTITITGTDFNAVAASNTVSFGATRATVSSATTTSLVVTVPVGSTFAPVSVTNTATGLQCYAQYPFLPEYNAASYVAGVINVDTKVDYAAGAQPYGIAICDIDGDGRADIIATNISSATASVYRNTSTSGAITSASFAAKADFATGTQPYSVVAGDMDGDGKPDLVICNNAANTVSILRNTAAPGTITSGSFAARVDFATGLSPIYAAIGDIDGDGKLDIAIANGSAATISVLRNTGSAGAVTTSSFAPKVDFAAGSHPGYIAIGDLNGDSKSDLAVVNSVSNTISVYRNTSVAGYITSSSFASKVDFATGSNPYSIAMGDIDGDGKVDLAVVNNSSNSISVFRNISTGGTITTASFSAKVDFTTGSGPIGIAISDFDADGRPDVAVTNTTSNSISVFRNLAASGSITSASLSPKTDFATAGAPKLIAAGDLDGDGKPDLAVADLSAGTISLFRNYPLVPISGTATICGSGNTATLTDATTGGSWSSSNTSVATVASGTGIITAVAGGSATITYSLGTGRFTTQSVSVTAPATIAGASSVCAGATTIWSNSITGGTWSSNDVTIATIGLSSGIVTGVMAGTTVVTYTIGGGCSGTRMIAVTPAPSPITGTTSVCTGGAATLASIGGGTWASSNSSVAAIGSSSGTFTGVSSGTAVITYSLSDCIATTIVTINPLPSAISGATNVCTGNTVTLTDGGSGTWYSSNTAVASIGLSSGIISGLTSGTAAITYTLSTGCTATTAITVNPAPAAIAGITAVCAGSTSALTAVGGGTWMSSDVTVATTGSTSGIVTGIAAGSAIITYTLATGCYTTTVFNVSPVPASIGGPTSVCAGSAVTLTNSGGGTWNSSNAGIASIGLATGVASGVTAGTATITYTLGSGCYATILFTVNATPPAITGPASICASTTATLANTVSGGNWTSGNTSVATIGLASGTLTGIAPGSASITYTLATGCLVTTSVVVNSLPAAITGTTGVCIGASTTLSDAGSGTWSSSNTGTAAIGSSTGVVTGVAAGTAIITYSIGVSCNSITTVTVYPAPPAIAGSTFVATGSTTTLTDATPGGLWTSASPSVAAIGSSSGIVSGVTLGTSAITYTVPTGCLVSTTVTVVSPASIIGATTVCAGASSTLTGSAPGGVWSSSNTGIASIGASSGIFLGVSGGTVVITYTYSATTSTTTITVLGAPVVTSLSISTGMPTTSVTVAGTNFNTVSTNNIVYFGAIAATVSAATSGTLSLTVPLGATYMPVSVENTGCSLTGYSQYPFLPVYDNSPYLTGSINFNSKVDFTAATNPISVAAGDIDGDGKADLVVVNNGENSVSVYRNTATSGVISSSSFAARVDFATGANPYSVAVGDIDGDGKLDIAVSNNSSNTISVLRNTATSGSVTSGSFAARVDFATGTNPISVAIGDMDKDGRADIVSANFYSGTVSVLRNTGAAGSLTTGSFAGKVDLTVGTHPYSVALGDVDGDGKRDIVVANQVSNSVSVLRNQAVIGAISSSSFAARVDFATGNQPYSVAIGDIDGDGKMDIVSANFGANTVSVLRNSATSGSVTSSSFASKIDFGTGTTPYAVSLGDIDGDGKADIVVANAGSNTVSVLRNIATSGSISSASIAAKIDFATGTSSRSVALADYDGDGKPDLAVANLVANSVSVLRNNPIPHPTAHAGGTTAAVTICVGSSMSMEHANGTWTSANPAIAAIDNETGLLTGVATGHTAIMYITEGSNGSVTTITPIVVEGKVEAVTIAAYPGTRIQKGQQVHFTAAVSGSVAQPVYQWYLGSTKIAGATQSSFISSQLAESDIVYCAVNNQAGCSGDILSNLLTLTTASQDNQGMATTTKDIRVVPNPNHGTFNIKGSLGIPADEIVSLQVISVLGEVVFEKALTAHSGYIDDMIVTDGHIANGMYILSLKASGSNTLLHIVIEQ